MAHRMLSCWRGYWRALWSLSIDTITNPFPEQNWTPAAIRICQAVRSKVVVVGSVLSLPCHHFSPELFPKVASDWTFRHSALQSSPRNYIPVIFEHFEMGMNYFITHPPTPL